MVRRKTQERKEEKIMEIKHYNAIAKIVGG